HIAWHARSPPRLWWAGSSEAQTQRRSVLIVRRVFAGARPKLRSPLSVVSERLSRGQVGPLRVAAQLRLQVAVVVAVEEVAQQPPVEIRGAEQPVGDRECQVHVGL